MATANSSQPPLETPPLNNRHVGVCEEGHQYDFFCTLCNSVFCGKCWVLTHKGALRSHEELEINDVMARNKDKIAESIKSLKELSGIVDTAIEKKTREMQEKDDELANFRAEVQRQLMRHTMELYLKKLQTTSNEIATAINKENSEMPTEVVDAITAQLALFDGLQYTDEMVRRTLDEKMPDIELSDAVERALAILKQNITQSEVLSTKSAPASDTSSSDSSGGTSIITRKHKQLSCPICSGDDIPPEKWKRFNCGHGVCTDCQKGLEANDYKCPTCKEPFKTAQGIQPKGSMNARVDTSMKIPGFDKDPDCRGAIVITYNIPNGTQKVLS